MSKLFVVATPIGNLQDITLRALAVLKSVDLILAEDTRVTKKLLAHFGIAKPIMAFHEYSKRGVLEKIVAMLEGGKDLALVTDAGTPGISDPGHRLMSLIFTQPRNVRDEGRTERDGASLQSFRSNEKLGSFRPHAPSVESIITPIPGPSAIAALISISDIDLSEFLFLGFPPHKKGRQTFFKRVAKSEIPTILFESPHRIQKTLKELEAAAGDRHTNIGRELTKIHEEIFRGTLSEAQKHFVGEKQRGEFVLAINVI